MFQKPQDALWYAYSTCPILINGVTGNTEKIKYIFLSSNVMENRIRPGNENSFLKYLYGLSLSLSCTLIETEISIFQTLNN